MEKSKLSSIYNRLIALVTPPPPRREPEGNQGLAGTGYTTEPSRVEAKQARNFYQPIYAQTLGVTVVLYYEGNIINNCSTNSYGLLLYRLRIVLQNEPVGIGW